MTLISHTVEFPVLDLFPDIKERRPLCPYCSKSFTFRHLLQWHFQRCHRDKGELFICSICNEAVIDESRFKSHVQAHLLDKVQFLNLSHVCEKCGASFRNEFKLKFHQLSHSKQTEKRGSGIRPPGCYGDEVDIEVGNPMELCRGCFTRRSFALKHCKKKFGNRWTLSL
ncbi:hypothetical protein TNCT_396231 [Trichonephila clavata]|uniref:C2H2-type domain-containing protein n=1 Tax=Trichonephila clavata TaxID=2740835 RepID=A0A8X6KX91_TRICU|nr:hypothetical protein TNCT_542881 [Trichonephila clavata]GFR07181.1 hypothetical protein TNCT_396231 [Trichonephila clavata]